MPLQHKRMKKGCFISVILGIVFNTAILTIEPLALLLGNKLSLLHRNGYFITSESSVYTFQETKMSDGSGEYWLYAEDENYFYSLVTEDKNQPYAIISREAADSIVWFDKTNYKTWNNPKIPCNDLLRTYAKKPKELAFLGCELVKNSQTIDSF